MSPLVAGRRSLKAAITIAAFALAAALPHRTDAQAVRNRVGPHGDFATIQAGVDACGAGTICSVDVEAGTYSENVNISSSLSAASITILGGWDSSFASRNHEAGSTTIDGGDAWRVIETRYVGDLSISGFTITGGSSVETGAGIWIIPVGASNASINLSFLEVTGNHASSALGFAYGGGIRAELDGTEHLEITRCEVYGNMVSATGGSGTAFGGGVSIAASGSATFLIGSSWIEDNVAASDTVQKNGAGHFISAIGDSTGELNGVNVSGNSATGTAADVVGSGGHLYASENGQITVRRSAWAFNADTTGDQSEQLRVTSIGTSLVQITDSAMALGNGHGLYASASDMAVLQLTNLTAVDNAAYGIIVNSSGSSSVSLYNSIAFGNGTDASLGAGVVENNNLLGVDPDFVAPGPPSYNYRLDAGSPGLDTGTNAPPGGLGTADLDNRPRVDNGTVDIGCYEGAGLLFLDGFEGGGTGQWSSSTP